MTTASITAPVHAITDQIPAIDSVTTQIIDRHYTFNVLFDVAYGIPNANNDGTLRITRTTEKNIISDSCVKRWIRDFVIALQRSGTDSLAALLKQTPFQLLYVDYDASQEDRNLESKLGQKLTPLQNIDKTDVQAGKAKKADDEKAKFQKKEQRRTLVAKDFWDVRVFGCPFMLDPKITPGRFVGTIQIPPIVSIDPVDTIELGVTSSVYWKEKKEEKKEAKGKRKQANDEMPEEEKQVISISARGGSEFGEREILEYALYRMNMSVFPHYAARNQTSFLDLAIVAMAIKNMLQFNVSTTKGSMSLRSFNVIEHPVGLCSYQHGDISSVMHVDPLTQNDGASVYPKNFNDYEGRIHCDSDNLPDDVIFRDLLKEQISVNTFPFKR